MTPLRRTLLLPRALSRSFHSPFLVLRDSLFPLSTPSLAPSLPNVVYEKQNDYPAEPFTTEFGTRTYVVSELDALSRYPNSVRCSSISTAGVLPITANSGFIAKDCTNIGGLDKDKDNVMHEAEGKERVTNIVGAWRTRRA